MVEGLISVIIPSYNRKDFICRAVDSVLNQHYEKKEIVIIDDGSTDGTFEFIKETYKDNSNVSIYKNAKNSGAGFSRKSGLQKCNGEFLIFMDDDDYYTNFDFFEHAVKVFRDYENVGMVSSSSVIEYVKEEKFEDSIMNISGLIDNSKYLMGFQKEYMKSNSTFTTLFRKQTLIEANFNDVEMVNDSSIYLRALLAGDAYVLNEISGVYRVHSMNITFNLKTDFIIKNLIEKRHVYDEIKKRNIQIDSAKWLKEQVLLTTEYFVENNSVSDSDFTTLINWCKNNCENGKDEIINRLVELRKDA